MEWIQLDQTAADAPNPFAAVYMKPHERAHAQEQMKRAMVVANLVLAVVTRVRNVLK
jgi:hypothetical protein